MNLDFNTRLASGYKSGTQIARILTEDWVAENMYCPRCGNPHITHFPNNRPVADFYCNECKNEYELKSKVGSVEKKINDGAYNTMIERITSNKNPDFLFMNYSKTSYSVRDLILIPKHFFVPDIIEKRKPLAETARRARWVGCNILIDKVPDQGRIYIIKNGVITDRASVLKKVTDGKALEVNEIAARGWIMDVLSCVNRIQTNTFSLAEIYSYSELLSAKHPQNNNVNAKIRQQLQMLRERGFIEFLGNGIYRKIK